MEMNLDAKAGNRETANNVLALTGAKPAAPAGCEERPPDDVLIHVRFHPNGLVTTIDRLPAHLSPQDWFYGLCYAAPSNYQVFASGRGFFRIQRSSFEAILSQYAA